MVNPFDSNFFKFIIGFALILGISFTVIYFTGKYGDSIDNRDVTATGKAN